MDPITISAIIGGATSIFSGIIGSKKNDPKNPRYNPLFDQEEDNTGIIAAAVFLSVVIVVIALIFIIKKKP
jgi:hypothetical protein